MTDGSSDGDLGEELRWLLRDPMPHSLQSVSLELFTWLGIDDELIDLEHSAAASPEAAGVRGADDTTTFTFARPSGDVLEVEFDHESRSLSGQLIPPRAATVVLQNPAVPDRVAESNSRGVFTFDDVATGPTRLVLRDPIDPSSARRTRWVVV